MAKEECTVKEIASGLFLHGVISRRSKKIFDKKERVIYWVTTPTQIYEVHHWEPKDYFSIGLEVTFCVRVVVSQLNGGIPQIRYLIDNTFVDDF